MNTMNNVSADWNKIFQTVCNNILTTQELHLKKFDNIDVFIEYIYDNYKSLIIPLQRWINKFLIANTGKNNELSIFFRSQGNDLLNQRKYKESLEKFTESIRFATTNSNELTLAYENRKKLLEILNKNTNNHEEKEPPKLLDGAHPSILHMSSALKLEENLSLGRHIIAKKNIKLGDVLFVEEPYCSVNAQIDLFTCAYCSKMVLNTIPCTNCSVHLYCSEECKSQDWKLYHRWECSGLVNTLGDNIGIARLALRILLKASHEDLRVKNFDSESSKKYYDVCNLITNFENMKIEDILNYGIMSIAIVYYLKIKTDFTEWFCKKWQMKAENISRYLSKTLMSHMCQMQCNAHSVVITDNDSIKESIRSAIYPSASLMNHSCDPNILNSFQDRYLIVRAKKDILEGEEVLNCYGISYETTEKLERRYLLEQQYYFICKCKKCVE